ncbi:MAG: dTTP/UTP pyrophosphatase [Succiniclasticum sp.]|jgi:septum formation protein
MKVLLASASPRRRELLRQIGWEADVRPVDFAEQEAGSPDEVCLYNARGKAAAAAAQYGDAVPVVAADTIVTVDGAVLGKPADAAEARTMLRTLSGRTHEVKTAVSVRWHGQERHAVETTVVEFRPLTDAEIAAYVATGEPMDKAGAYGIQGKGAILVSRIAGSYDNVVGLPRTLVYTILQGLGAL